MSKPELRPPAGHESADVRVVAPVSAGQQGDTLPTWAAVLIAALVLVGLLAALGVTVVYIGRALVVIAQLMGITAAKVLS